MKIIAALLPFIPVLSLAQVNLNFQDDGPGPTLKGWEIPKNVRGTAEKRTLGCQSAACVTIDRSLVQKFPAAPYRGSTVVIRAHLRIVGGDSSGSSQLFLRTDGPHGMRMTPSEEDIASKEWRRTGIVTEIDPDADSITLGVAALGKSRVWMDNLSFEAIPAAPADTPSPVEVRGAYQRIDSAYGDAAIASIAPLLAPGWHASALPFRSRIAGFRKLLENGAHLRDSTAVQRVRALSGNYAVIDARSELTRYSSDRSYSYTLTYKDLWTKTPQGWLLRDAPPVSIRFVEAPQPPPAAAPTSLFAIPAVNDAVPCGLTTESAMNLGPTDYRNHLLPLGPLSALMVFVDFPDAPHTETTERLYDSLVSESSRWIASVSHGKASLNVTPVHRWVRMPKPSTDYRWREINRAGLRTYIQQAIQGVPDPESYDLVYVVASGNSGITDSLAFREASGIRTANGSVRQAVLLGTDIRNTFPNYGPHVLVQVMGNLFGLPSLYEYATASARLVGGWDDMSLPSGGYFTAWNQWKLGWLSQAQLQCVAQGSTTSTLRPIETPDGLKALVIPIDGQRAYVAEAREWIGADSQLCDEGLLIYKIDLGLRSGHGPMQVIGGTRGTGDEGIRQCGPAYDATFGLEQGKPNLFEDPAAGISIELLESSLGTYKVKATKGLANRAIGEIRMTRSRPQ